MDPHKFLCQGKSTNLSEHRGPFRRTFLFLGDGFIREQGIGQDQNFATNSPGTQVGVAGLDAYTAAKGGVIAMTRSLAAGLARYGIRVNAISPGFINTEPQSGWMNNADSRKQIESLHLLPIPDPEAVVPLAVFLASHEARSITGSIHQVDAGYTAFKSSQVDAMAALNRT